MATHEADDIFTRLDRAFDTRTVIKGNLLHQALELRHQVYCNERDYEQAEGGIETDSHDRHSLHAVILDRELGEAVATVRLVRPGDGTFPLEGIPGAALERFLPRCETMEISRFAISKERRGKASIDGFLRLCLLQAIVSMSHGHGVKYWCAVMEPGLLRLLKSSGIHFHTMGDPVEYHGTRQPVWGQVEGILARMAAEKPRIWTYVTGGGRSFPGAVTPTRTGITTTGMLWPMSAGTVANPTRHGVPVGPPA